MYYNYKYNTVKGFNFQFPTNYIFKAQENN